MRPLSARQHGLIDYPFGLLLIALPYLGGFADGTVAQHAPQVVGALILAMSLVTDYPPALVRRLPLPLHLAADICAGIVLAASPWMLFFSDRVRLPHLLAGLALVLAGAMTRGRDPAPGGADLRA